MTDVTSDIETGEAAVGATGAVDDGLVAELVARAQAGGVKLTGEGGLLQQLTEGHRDILGLWTGDGGEVARRLAKVPPFTVMVGSLLSYPTGVIADLHPDEDLGALHRIARSATRVVLREGACRCPFGVPPSPPPTLTVRPTPTRPSGSCAVSVPATPRCGAPRWIWST